MLFESKDFGVFNALLSDKFRTADPFKTWHSKNAFLTPGLNALFTVLFKQYREYVVAQ